MELDNFLTELEAQYDGGAFIDDAIDGHPIRLLGGPLFDKNGKVLEEQARCCPLTYLFWKKVGKQWTLSSWRKVGDDLNLTPNCTWWITKAADEKDARETRETRDRLLTILGLTDDH